MRIFVLEKGCKNRSASGGPPPEPCVVTFTYYYNLVEFVSSANSVLLP